MRASPRVRIAALPSDAAVEAASNPPWLILGVAPWSWVERTGHLPFWPPAEAGAAGPPTLPSIFVLRVTHRDQLQDLPGLDGRDAAGAPLPSLVRDAAALGLAGGSPSVEVALMSWPGAVPWRFYYDPATNPGLDPLFNDLPRRMLELRPGRMVVVPDAAGPATLVEPRSGWRSNLEDESSDEIAARWLETAERLLPFFDEFRQVGLLDRPMELSRSSFESNLRPLFGRALAVCAWAGAPERLAEHGWRSAAAAVAAGLLGVSGDSAVRPGGLLSRRLPLGAGRAPTAPWNQRTWVSLDVADSHLVILRIDPTGQSAAVVREPTLLRPVGAWSLTAVWTARLIVARVEQIASTFVFRLSNAAAALELQLALLRGLAVFVREGVLASGDEATEPRVDASAPADRGAPRLEATIRAVLLPWTVSVDVSVEITGFGPPVVRWS